MFKHNVLVKNTESFFLVLVILLQLFSCNANAHEMWIEPVKYQIEKDAMIFAHEKVGQNFKGNEYSYLDSSYEKIDITVNNETHPIKSRIGDIPAIHVQAKKEGLTILSAVTTVSDISYETWAKFESFIKSKELDWVLIKHKKRGLPDKGFTEAYQRFPKALVKVGAGAGKDKILGMRLEWLIETNPYATPYKKDGVIKARLLWEGKPLKFTHVGVFNKLDNQLIKTSLSTDENGVVNIPQANGGEFLINAVQMVEPSEKVRKETGAVWESLWASVTYKLNP